MNVSNFLHHAEALNVDEIKGLLKDRKLYDISKEDLAYILSAARYICAKKGASSPRWMKQSDFRLPQQLDWETGTYLLEKKPYTSAYNVYLYMYGILADRNEFFTV